MSYFANKVFQTAANVYRKKACDGKARPLYAGELHVGCHNYTGKGTRIDLKDVLNFKPYNNIDACSRTHDIDYYQAKDLSGDQKKFAIRKADDKVLDCYDKFPNDSGYTIAKAGIAAKVKIENVAPKLIEKVLGDDYLGKAEAQEGGCKGKKKCKCKQVGGCCKCKVYGRGKSVKSVKKVAVKSNKWIEHVRKVQVGKGLSYKDAMVEAKKSYKK